MNARRAPRPRHSLRIQLLVVLASMQTQALTAAAQAVIPDERPADERPEARPLPDTPGPRDRAILPPYPIPPEEAPYSGVRVRIRSVRIHGNETLPDELLRRIAAPYEGRALDHADLLELRDRLTLAYTDRGYLTSGAVLPAQAIRDGVVQIEIVEGRLGEIEIETDGRFRDAVLERRLRPRSDRALDVRALETRLRTLQSDRRIERVDARLEPGPVRSESRLVVTIHEAPPLFLGADFDNHRSPSIGSLGGRIRTRYDNVAGVGDWLEVEGAFSEGLTQLAGVVSVPITPWQTRLSLRFQWSDANIVSEPIASALDIETSSRTIGAELRQPLWQSPSVALETFLRGELRRSQSYLEGTRTSFAPGVEEGLAKVSVLRWGLEWTYRSRKQAIALRSLFSIGLELFDATSNAGGVPDGQFLAWLAQAQWARRLPAPFEAEAVLRTDLQLANSPLLPLEQFALGGRYSVRGYRENTLVRDNGFVGSFELRVPIYRRIEPSIRWEVSPFFDVGHSWSTKRATGGERTLLSVGLGTRLFLTRSVQIELFWGHRVEDVATPGEDDLQDDGVHLRLSARWP